MHIRFERLLILVALPGLVLLGILAYHDLGLYLRDRGVHQGTATATYYTSGFIAAMDILAVFVILACMSIARVAVEPVSVLTSKVRSIARGERNIELPLTQIADIDEALTELNSAANASVKRLNAERTLAADVSHQLRSPLTALSLRLEQIAANTKDTNVHDDALSTLNQVERLVQLVESLLTTWRTTSDRRLERIIVAPFLRAAADSWTEKFAQAGRRIVVSCDEEIAALATRGVQELVLSVLLENSLKYGAGTTSLRVTDYRTWVLIEVGDEGDGIADDVRSELMTPGSTTEGTGLGLAWARSQVAADGGRLELRSIKPAVFGVFLIAEHQEMEIEAY